MTDGNSTFLFADMAGFTALTEAHGDEHAAEAAAGFCERVRALLGTEGEVIKQIGDAAMCRSADAAAAIEVSLRLTRHFGEEHGALPVRVGMHTGPAVERDGDWYGGTERGCPRGRPGDRGRGASDRGDCRRGG